MIFFQEYNALFGLFSKCNECVNATRYRSIFRQPACLAIEYLQREKSSIKENHAVIVEVYPSSSMIICL